MDCYQWGGWGKGTGNKKHKMSAQNRQGEFKNSIGNGEAKELIRTTHGHIKGCLLYTSPSPRD